MQLHAPLCPVQHHFVAYLFYIYFFCDANFMQFLADFGQNRSAASECDLIWFCFV